MASISVTYIDNSSCCIELINLDTSWGGGDRTVYYNIINNGVIQKTYNATISGAPDAGGFVIAWGLSPSTTYTVSCTVYDADRDVLATPSSVDFTTTDTSSDGDIAIFDGNFYVEQTAYGEKQALVDINCEDGFIGCTYSISANGVVKSSGAITKDVLDSGVIISFDEFGLYVVGLSVTTPSGSVYTKENEHITIEGDGLEQNGWYYIMASTIGELSSMYRKNFAAGTLATEKYYHRIYRYSMTFEKSGKALFYTTKGVNYMYIDLSADTEYAYKGGWSVLYPTNSLASSQGYKSRFACEVEAGVTYYLWIRCDYADNSAAETVVIVPPIEAWDWEASEDKRNAFRALTQKGPTTDFNYSVWNELVNKVKTVAEADPDEGSWIRSPDDGIYYTAGQTKINPNDKTLEADKFNALRYNVCEHVYTGIGIKNHGDAVIGQEFITITDCLNVWITKIFT